MILLLSPYRYAPDETIIYIEKYDKESKTLLIDFFDSNQFGLFSQFTALNYNWEEKPTMIAVTNYKLKSLREGSYYRISGSTWAQIAQRGLLAVVEDSYTIGFEIELPDDLETFALDTKIFTEGEKFFSGSDQSFLNYIPHLEEEYDGRLRVIVKNVGQGSWNEMLSNHSVKIVFDCGTLYTQKKSFVDLLAATRDAKYQKDSPCLIISHWDVDHYHLLLSFNDATIAAFDAIICRGAMPNLTSRKVLGRFQKLNKRACYFVRPEIKDKRKGTGYLQPYHITMDASVLLFNGSVTTSRNKSGFGMLIRQKHTGVVLSADYHYKQVSDYILPHLNYDHNHYLVIPHHGGNAGRFVYHASKNAKLIDAIASVGKNPYSHPDKVNMNHLKKIGFKVLRTDILKKDYLINVH